MTNTNTAQTIGDIIREHDGPLTCEGHDGIGDGWDIALPGDPTLDSSITDLDLTLDEIARNEALICLATGAYDDCNRRGPWIFEVALYDEYYDVIASGEATVIIGPDAPDECGDDWRSPHDLVGGIRSNPGVQAKGGGVVINEICAASGVWRVRDTWDQDFMDTGDPVETVRYYTLADPDYPGDCDAVKEWLTNITTVR